MEFVTLAHGSGGINSADFVQKVFMPYFMDIMPYANEDSGIFCNDSNKYVTSTDSYIITPLFFSGGNIGKLCVCGSSNDVSMMGGKPLYINIGFIIEEGFEVDKIKQIAKSISIECKALNLNILSADTKVLPRIAKIDSNNEEKSLFITTTCIGQLEKENISANNLQKDDCIILSGKIGNHGARIFLEQNKIEIDGNIKSDCASLYPMLMSLFQSEITIHALRDATRGGLSSVLNEWAISSNACIEIYEENIVVDDEVYGVCEILGLEPYDLANEGVCVISAKEENAKDIVNILRKHELGQNATIIGRVCETFDVSNKTQANIKKSLDIAYNKKVILKTKYGSKRFLEYPQGELLPRIC